MCLAIPGRIIECRGDEALVDFHGNRLEISKIMTPDAAPGDWVLVHAGFSICTIDEHDALETWSYLRQVSAFETDEPVSDLSGQSVPKLGGTP